MGAKILIVDDEASIQEALRQLFEYEEHRVAVAASAKEAFALLESFGPDAIFLDVKMPEMDGLEALTRIREHDAHVPIIMISGHGTIDTAVDATRRGAFDFLEKPLDSDRLRVVLRNALALRGLSADVARLRAEVQERYEIVGASFQIRQVLERVEKVAPTDARVLIVGENGTGKELVARAIHRLSRRAQSPFIEVNCAAIPSELIESELFGHIKGSFTGAVSDRAGKFEQAKGGTLFLDEVGDMSAATQAKVLRALEEGIVTRVGGSKPVHVDARVIAATNKNLPEEIAAGRFREDLYYRLNVVPIHVPPLRERREDIPMLVQHFEDRLCQRDGLPPKRFSEEAIEWLRRSDWPGNVRELRNTVERLMILAPSPVIDVGTVRMLLADRGGTAALAADLLSAETFSDFKERAERAFILHKLRENDWNVSETARRVDMPRSNLYKKIERYGLAREE